MSIKYGNIFLVKNMQILVLNGPNLNLLGERNPKHYGTFNLTHIKEHLQKLADAHHISLIFTQTNHEGEIIEQIHNARGVTDAIILNAGAFTHYSYAIRDAIEAVTVPVIEVHLSNIHAREDFRQKSVIAPVCAGQISGFGLLSYELAFYAAIKIVKGS